MPDVPNLSTLSDEQLAELIRTSRSSSAQGQSVEAFQQLHTRHARLLIAFLAARVSSRSDAEDLAQVVWISIWERLPTQFQGGNFRAWLHEIARNRLIDQYRRKKPVALSAEYDVADRRAESESDGRAEKLKGCLQKLEEERAAIVTARLAGESFEQISERLGIPANTAMTRFHRAKDQLRACIERGTP